VAAALGGSTIAEKCAEPRADEIFSVRTRMDRLTLYRNGNFVETAALHFERRPLLPGKYPYTAGRCTEEVVVTLRKDKTFLQWLMDLVAGQ
jgi:hypothetical protein